MKDFSLVVVAGGSGLRMGGQVKKPFLKVGDRTLLEHTLAAFHGVPGIAETVVVLPGDELEQLTGLKDRVVELGTLASPPLPLATRLQDLGATRLASGGLRRQDSVLNGLRACRGDLEFVLIHDAARPFVAPEMVVALMDKVRKGGAAILAIPVRDTIKRVGKDGAVRETVDRSSLWAAQTPQGFRKARLLQAFEKFGEEDVTDDAALLARFGDACAVVQGDAMNFKVTAPEDLEMAEALLARRGKGDSRTRMRTSSARFHPVTTSETVVALGPSSSDVKARPSDDEPGRFSIAIEAEVPAQIEKQPAAEVQPDPEDPAAAAVEAARRMAARSPEDPAVWIALGGALVQAGRFEEADLVLDQALQLDERNATARVHRAVALLQLGREDEAAALIREALALDPRIKDELEQIGLL